MKTSNQKLPLSVKAPIIVDNDKQKLFANYMKSLSLHNNVAVAVEEGKRLRTQFRAMSRHLGSSTYTPQKLCDMFVAVAAHTHNTVLSDVVVLPHNIIKRQKFVYINGFNHDYKCRKYVFNFGFMQVHEEANIPSYSTGFAFYAIDKRMAAVVRKLDRKDMLEPFQAIMTFVNHDPRHHYTSPCIDENVAVSHINTYETPIWPWFQKLPGAYETWAHISHEKTILDPKNAGFVRQVVPHVKKYFACLDEMAKAMIKSGQSKAEAHAVVDYFGLIALHALARVFPLDHAVMKKGLALMQSVDPAPEMSILDYTEVRDLLKSEHWLLKNAYKKRGFDIFPGNDKKVGYVHFIIAELAKMGGLETHVSGVADKELKIMRRKSDQQTASMLSAVTKMVRKELKQ